MNKFKLAFRLSLFVFSLFAFASMASAQATRTWVSGVGDDVNPCSRTAACKTFAGAISKTATNGEINCLDGGGFGAVTITKSITIDCSDVPSSILGALTTGVIVNLAAGDAAKTVRLRGLSINGAGSGINGIRVITAVNSVFIEDVVIDGFTQHGISLETSSGLAKIFISNATISNNTGNGFNTFLTGGASVNLSVTNSLFAANNIGFNLGASVKTAFERSVISGNNTGVLVNAGELTMTGCQISLNNTGVQVGSGGTIRLANNTISGNGTGISGTSMISLGNNVIKGNTTNGAPTSTEALN
jgi:parallel beta-helix repeat protein